MMLEGATCVTTSRPFDMSQPSIPVFHIHVVSMDKPTNTPCDHVLMLPSKLSHIWTNIVFFQWLFVYARIDMHDNCEYDSIVTSLQHMFLCACCAGASLAASITFTTHRATQMDKRHDRSFHHDVSSLHYCIVYDFRPLVHCLTYSLCAPKLVQ